MLDAVSVTAYAKVNIHLKVGKKRASGFHDIESIFQEISVADELSVSIADTFSLSVIGADLPERNSLSSAYNAFCRATGFDRGLRVVTVKTIPFATGLGGASADAVALLKAMDGIACTNLSVQNLQEIAASIGSDCPFFVTGGAAFVTGRGETVHPLPSKTAFGILLVPALKSSTAEAYSLLDKMRGNVADSFASSPDRKRQLVDLFGEPMKRWTEGQIHFENDFESVICNIHPEVRQAKADLLTAGAVFAQMSGSGSSVFGLFTDMQKLQRASVSLKRRYHYCEPFICR